MILGFAHLTVATDDTLAAANRWIEAGWQHTETLKDVPSAPEKLPIMNAPATTHDLVLLSGKPAIEIVVHDIGVEHGDGSFGLEEDGTVRLSARNLVTEREFLCKGFGFEVVDGEADQEPHSCLLRMKSRFQNWQVNLRLVQDDNAPQNPPLDRVGFSCLAFYSTDLVGDLERLIEHGGRDATEAFDLFLGNRHISVHMLRSPQGVIFETIKIRGRV